MFSSCVSRVATRFLHTLAPETAHHVAIRLLSLGLYPAAKSDSPRLATQCLNMNLPNPIGLAAGFDKDCRAARALSRMGFGFVECGTVTPRPQPGNPRPRLFRLPEDGAIINRLGFNSGGTEAFLRRLRHIREMEAKQSGHARIGVNLGINKEGAKPERDYAQAAASFSLLADYLTINLSSPNTPGLRDLQGARSIAGILQAIRKKTPLHTPLLVKIAPDLAREALDDIVEACVDNGAAGLIVSNTTVSRPHGLVSPHQHEMGGLSGRPLSQLAITMLRDVARLNRGRMTLISSGGIETGFDVLERLRAGADLVQIYAAFVLHGPAMISRIKRELLHEMSRCGFETIKDVIANRNI